LWNKVKAAVQFIVVKESFDDTKDFVNFWKSEFEKLGKNWTFEVNAGLELSKEIPLGIDIIEALTPQQKESREIYIKNLKSNNLSELENLMTKQCMMVENHLEKKDFKNRVPCGALWKQPFITAAGFLSICCRDIKGEAVYGDLTDNKFSKLFYSNKAHSFRLSHITGEFNNPSKCYDCLGFEIDVMSDDEILCYLNNTDNEKYYKIYKNRELRGYKFDYQNVVIKNKEIFKNFIKQHNIENIITSDLNNCEKYEFNDVFLMWAVSNKCNLNCYYCPENKNKNLKPTKNMSFETFKKCVDNIDIKTETFAFGGYGEPLINPDFIKMIEYSICHTKQKFKNIYIFSNGTLWDKSFSDNFINFYKSSKNQPEIFVYFSAGASNKETYTKIKGSDVLEKTENNIKYFISKISEEKLTGKIFTGIQFIVTEETQNEGTDFDDKWKGFFDKNKITFVRETDVGIKLGKLAECSLEYVELITEKKDKNNIYKNFLSQPLYKNLLKEIPEHATEIIENVEHRKPCPALWRSPIVDFEGNLVLCCWDRQSENVYGNLTENTFTEIFINNPQAVKWRMSHINGEFLNPQNCSNCRSYEKYPLSKEQIDNYIASVNYNQVLSFPEIKFVKTKSNNDFEPCSFMFEHIYFFEHGIFTGCDKVKIPNEKIEKLKKEVLSGNYSNIPEKCFGCDKRIRVSREFLTKNRELLNPYNQEWLVDEIIMLRNLPDFIKTEFSPEFLAKEASKYRISWERFILKYDKNNQKLSNLSEFLKTADDPYLYLLLMRGFEFNKNIDKFDYFFEKFKKLVPSTISVFKTAQGDYDIKNHEKVLKNQLIQNLQKKIELYSDNDEFKLRLGVLYRESKKYDKALEIFNMLLEKNSENKQKIVIEIIYTLKDKGDYKQALQMLKDEKIQNAELERFLNERIF